MNTKLNHVQDWPTLAWQSKWSVKSLAFLCGVSIRTLEVHFEKSLRMAPKTWLCKQRHQRALGFLREGFTVKETASKLGFKRANQFSKEFKRIAGYLPSEEGLGQFNQIQQP